MHMLYDTRTVHPLDRYHYYRAAAGAELAPVEVHGRSPGQFLAAMSVAQIGEFTIEETVWAADSEILVRRTDRLIRASDPECYRICLSVSGGLRAEQAGNQVFFRVRDVGLYDVSRPWQTAHTTGHVPRREVMLTFPRSLVPVSRTTIRPLLGTVMPRSLPGRDLIAQLLIGLTDTAVAAQIGDPSTVEALHECAVGLIRQRLGQPDGITPRTRRLLAMVRVRDIIRRNLGDPALDPDRIAKAANFSTRYLHKIFRDAELTPMQLLKRLRLEECRRILQDPALAMTPIKEVMFPLGYRRSDQFARDFKQLFGVSPKQVRALANQPPSGARSEP